VTADASFYRDAAVSPPRRLYHEAIRGKSDLSKAKLRPAVILAEAGRGDSILCQATSNPYGDPQALPLADGHFRSGSLHLASFVRPAKIFTAEQTLIFGLVNRIRG
jgi:mRNA interferase MazF